MIFSQLEAAGRDPGDRALLRKITPSLVTLLAAEPEVQYVALRNISLIVEKYPGLLSHEVKVRKQRMTHFSPAAQTCACLLGQALVKNVGQLAPTRKHRTGLFYRDDASATVFIDEPLMGFPKTL